MWIRGRMSVLASRGLSQGSSALASPPTAANSPLLPKLLLPLLVGPAALALALSLWALQMPPLVALQVLPPAAP